MNIKHVPFMVSLCVVIAIPNAFGAPPYDPWADDVDATNTVSVTDAANATGAPDGQTAVVASLLGASLSLDLGENEESDRDLLVYYAGVAVGLIAPVEFYDAGFNLVASADLLLAASVGPALAAALYTNSVPYRYVILRGSVTGVYGVDAIKAINLPEPPDGFADAASTFGTTLIVNPNNAVGAPDGQYATIVSLLGGGIQLDMGAGEEGTWDLIVHYGALAIQLATTVVFLDENSNVLASAPLLLAASVGNAQAAVAYTNAPNPYRYVRINALLNSFLLDAVETITAGPDSDGDGILDIDEDPNNNGNLADDDTDGNGIPNALDPDDDGDSIPTIIEVGGDPNNPVDTDGDSAPDYLDPDDDGDSIPTITEVGGDPNNPVDTDNDSTPDYLDPDDDGDTMPTLTEVGGDPNNPIDTDGDGTPDYLDPDDDGDTVPTIIEVGGDPNNPVDTDNDSTPDYLDPDDDGDGIPTKIEDRNGNGDPTDDDTDGDGTPDYLDPDPAHIATFIFEPDPGVASITWTNLLPGYAYHLQGSASLLEPDWQTLVTNAIAPSQSLTLENILIDQSEIKHFRLVEIIPVN